MTRYDFHITVACFALLAFVACWLAVPPIEDTVPTLSDFAVGRK